MASDPPPLPGAAMSRAMAEAREAAKAEYTRPPGTPPPLPTRVAPTLRETAEQAALKLSDARAANLLDESELERFRNLLVFAKTAVEGRYQGRHKSPDLGGGGEFTEYLAYEPGRPVQDIDWHVYARCKRLVIRRYRQETDMDVHLLVDSSGSMAYHGGKREKKGLRAARIAASLAYLMLKQGDKASITLFSEKIIGHVPPGGTRRQLMAMLRALVRPGYASSGGTDLPASITECARLIRRRGRLVILSDFLGPQPSAVFDALAPFVHRRFEILLMQLTDPDELTLPDAPLARFVDMETDESIEVEPSEIRADYEKRIRSLIADYADNSSRHRIEFASLTTDSPHREAIEAYLGFRGKNR